MIENLKLYYVNMKYIRDLHRVDDHVVSVSPQTGKQDRPFIGIITIVKDKEYCIPLTSGNKDKFKNKKNSIDFIKIPDENKKNENGAYITIGGINLNNMIPIDRSIISPIDLKVDKNDNKKVRNDKIRLTKELDWCQRNRDLITRRANRLYDLYVNHPKENISLTRRCCDFKKLEKVLEKYLSNKGLSASPDKNKEQPNTERIVIDTKTTGLSLFEDELLQVSIINTEGTVLYNEYVKPTAHETWEAAMAVNNITPEMVAGAKTIEEQLSEISKITLNAKEIIGYNTYFDIDFLSAAGVEFSDTVKVTDVKAVFTERHGVWDKYKGDFKWIKLTECAEHYGYDWNSNEGQAHNSVSDCFATLHCYDRLQEEIAREQRSKTNEKAAPIQAAESKAVSSTSPVPSKHFMTENSSRRKR